MHVPYDILQNTIAYCITILRIFFPPGQLSTYHIYVYNEGKLWDIKDKLKGYVYYNLHSSNPNVNWSYEIKL